MLSKKYYSCSYCNYIANWKDNLVNNLQTHREESGGEMQNEINRTEINNLRLERSIQPKIINQKPERWAQTRVINQKTQIFKQKSYDILKGQVSEKWNSKSK